MAPGMNVSNLRNQTSSIHLADHYYYKAYITFIVTDVRRKQRISIISDYKYKIQL